MPTWLTETVARVLTILAVLVSGAVFLYSTVGSRRPALFGGVEVKLDQQVPMKAIEEQISQLRLEVKALEDTIQGAANLPKEAKFGVQLQQIQSAVADIQMRQGKLEQAILANPSKALEIPLLQRDLENLRATQQANILTVKEGVDRVYDLNKGLLGAMAVSVVTLAIANFLKGKESSGEKK